MGHFLQPFVWLPEGNKEPHTGWPFPNVAKATRDIRSRTMRALGVNWQKTQKGHESWKDRWLELIDLCIIVFIIHHLHQLELMDLSIMV